MAPAERSCEPIDSPVRKHGDGKSCETLLKREPGLFYDFGHPSMNEGRRADHLRVDADHFGRFVASRPRSSSP